MNAIQEEIQRRRMHGLYLSRQCDDITELSRELLGLHCWFHRNVAFSALIRGAGLSGWKRALTKTWLYRGTLHGVADDQLPQLLALHSKPAPYEWFGISEAQFMDIADRVIRLMEDGVYSRAEMRRIFAYDHDERLIRHIFSPWGGIFVYLAGIGRVAFRDMTSRDFDLIDAQPTQSSADVLPDLLRQYLTAYGPASLEDAAWFFGLQRERKKELSELDLSEYSTLKYGKSTLYYVEPSTSLPDIPEITLLAGFDPIIVSYMERSAILPQEYKSAVILKSGICLPTIAINGQVAGLWNLKKNEPVIDFFTEQPQRIQNAALGLVAEMQWRTAGRM